MTVQRLFSKFSQIARNVQKTLFDSRPTVAWPPTTVAWPFSDFFQKFSWLLETSKKRGLTVVRRSRDLRPLSRDRSATFFKIFPNRLKRPKNVVWQSANGRVTSTTVAWPFSDFFQNFRKSLETSRKRCLTVGRRSRDLRLLSRDRSVTFFKNFPNCLKRPKNVVWQSSDGRVTSDHCRVTVQRLFSNFSQIVWNVQKTLFDTPPTVAWPPTTVAWPFSDFFQNFPKSLETSKNVVWQSADGRVTSDHCRGTVQRLFSKFSQIAWNVQKTLFDSQPTVAWPLTTVAWPFSDFFQNFPKSLETSKNVVWQSADGRVTSDHCRVTVRRLFSKKFLISLKRPKNVVWQSSDGRVTSDHCRVTVQRLFSKFSQIAWNVQKTLFDSQPTVAWPPTTVAWPSDFFQNFPKSLETSKNVVWQSADGRVTSTTVAWPFSDFFQSFPKSLETSKKRCLTVGRRSRDLRPRSRDCSATFFKFFSNCLKRPKNVVWQSADGRVTSDHCRVTVQRLFSNFFLIAWNVQKTLFDSRPTVAWPQPLSRDRSATFFKIFANR